MQLDWSSIVRSHHWGKASAEQKAQFAEKHEGPEHMSDWDKGCACQQLAACG